MMKKLYPLKFAPTYKEKVWGGGDTLFARVNPSLAGVVDGTNPVGEIWEIFDIEGESPKVTNGFLADNDLSDLVETYLGDLVGDNIFDFFRLQFPLTVKLLGIKDYTSLQVHPDDTIALERFDSYGKEEWWYVMDALPDAVVYMGFKKEVSASEVYEACMNGTLLDLMNVIKPKKGDCFLIRPGIVHSAGGGIVLAEVAQPGNITMRLYDWGRESDNRLLCVEEALDFIDCGRADESLICNSARKSGLLVDTPNFTISKLEIDGPYEIDTDRYNSCIMYVSVDGTVSVDSEGQGCDIECGESVLIPSRLDGAVITPKSDHAVLLEVSVREQKDAEDEYMKG